ncbi:MAG: four helix bundle protein [Chlorobi bacterium]|nr:four helix bundle protein [Chlorobiota bacterium]
MKYFVEEPKSGYNKERDFTSLICWQDARKVKLFFYKQIIPKLPEEEKFNLNIQIRKAAVSSTANIAEGYGRFHYQEGIQFYRISRGSIYELKDHLISSLDFEYITNHLFKQGIDLIETAKISLNGFINYSKKQKEST